MHDQFLCRLPWKGDTGFYRFSIILLYVDFWHVKHVFFYLNFPTCNHILTCLQQTTFENIVAKGECSHDEQFLHLPQCFQLYLIIMPLFMIIFPIYANIFSKLLAADLQYVGKGTLLSLFSVHELVIVLLVTVSEYNCF